MKAKKKKKKKKRKREKHKKKKQRNLSFEQSPPPSIRGEQGESLRSGFLSSSENAKLFRMNPRRWSSKMIDDVKRVLLLRFIPTKSRLLAKKWK